MPDQRRQDRTHPRRSVDAGSGEAGNEPAPPPEDPRPGLLKRTTAADRGLVEKPVLTPHLEYRPIEGEQVLLVSETFNTLLREPIHSDLLPLLDGRRSHRDIVAALAPTHSALDVRAAIVSLATRGYVVSGDFTMDRERAAYWSSLGVSPRRAEERLSASSVAVAGDTGRLARRLDAMGVAVHPEHPTLTVVVCADYLEESHHAVNRRHIASGAPWMLVRPKGMQPLFGPVFRPAEQGPCWACLAYRLRGHREVHDFLRNVAGDDAAFRPGAAEPAVLDAVYGFVAAEVAKWLLLRDTAPIHERAISLDTGRLTTEHHPTKRRPQCSVCGDEAWYRPDRPPVALRLRSSPQGVRNSGGLRSVPPEETLARCTGRNGSPRRPARGRRAQSRTGDCVRVVLHILRRAGLAGRTTVHGFRSSFRSWVGECTDADHAVMEPCLAHTVGNAVERAYAGSDLMAKRRTLMAAWAEAIGTS